MKKMLIAVVVGLVIVGTAGATSLRPIPLEARAGIGATHVVEFNYADFAATTATNTAVVFTNSVGAKKAVEFVGMVLPEAFEISTATNITRVGLKIGDGSDDDLFMASTELASDGTEVFVKYGPPDAITLAPTMTTNILAGVGGETNTVIYISAATASAAALGKQTFNSAGIIRYTFTPNADHAMGSMTTGKVRVYFRVWSPLDF